MPPTGIRKKAMCKSLLGGCAGFAWARKVVAIVYCCIGRGDRDHRWSAFAWVAGAVALTYPAALANADPPTAEQFYQEQCKRCHGANGSNPNLYSIFPDLPDFTDRTWQAAHTKAEMKESILNGKSRMPAWKDDLDGVKAGDLVDYLRKFSQQPHAGPAKTLPQFVPKTLEVPQVPKGSKTDLSAAARFYGAAHFYGEHCAQCHGAHGASPMFVVFPGIPDFTNRTWQTAYTKSELKKAILNGKGSSMPAWKGDLGGVKAGDLVDYLRTLAKPDQTK
jgi:mono/diheme cytochrome c family protein